MVQKETSFAGTGGWLAALISPIELSVNEHRCSCYPDIHRLLASRRRRRALCVLESMTDLASDLFVASVRVNCRHVVPSTIRNDEVS